MIYKPMRHLQTYRLFEATQDLTPDQQKFLDRGTRGIWSINPLTGLVDIQGDFRCSRQGIKNLHGIRFGSVSGDFECSNNELTSLEGAPQTVGRDFECGYTQLTSLEGAPQTIGRDFSCRHNQLTSLEGAPQTIGRDFDCGYTQLTSLEGAPQTIGEDFYCHGNELTSLKGAPQILGGTFYSSYLDIPEGKWGLETFIDLSEKGNPREKQLVAPLVDPKVLQQQIDQNPEGMLVKLKGLLKHPHLQGLRWPENLVGEVDLLSDLSDIGL